MSGGGIFNIGTTTLTNCTVSGNTAVIRGGGMSQRRHDDADQLHRQRQHVTGSRLGGGMYNGGTTTLTNCTVSGNTAGAGGGMRQRRHAHPP